MSYHHGALGQAQQAQQYSSYGPVYVYGAFPATRDDLVRAAPQRIVEAMTATSNRVLAAQAPWTEGGRMALAYRFARRSGETPEDESRAAAAVVQAALRTASQRLGSGVTLSTARPSGPGTIREELNVSARLVQQLLVRTGYLEERDVDGVAGSGTTSALTRAMREHGLSARYTVEADRTSITFYDIGEWRKMQTWPSRVRPGVPATPTPTPEPEEEAPPLVPAERKFPWVPVAIGGAVVLAGVGAYFVVKARKKKVAANRRYRRAA